MIKVVSAFVVSDLRSDGSDLGYEGIVRDLKIGADGEIKTLSLSDCDRFVRTVKPEGLERVAVDRSMIPFVMLEAANIKSIALNPYFDVEALLAGDDELSPEEEAALLEAETKFPEEGRG